MFVPFDICVTKPYRLLNYTNTHCAESKLSKLIVKITQSMKVNCSNKLIIRIINNTISNSGWKQQFSQSAHPNLQSVRAKHFQIYIIETLYYIILFSSQSGRKLQIAQRTVRHHSWVSQTCCPTLANTFCYLVL